MSLDSVESAKKLAGKYVRNSSSQFGSYIDYLRKDFRGVPGHLEQDRLACGATLDGSICEQLSGGVSKGVYHKKVCVRK